MVPTPLRLTTAPHSSRLLVLLYSIASRHVTSYFHPSPALLKRAEPEKHDTKFIVFACLIPVLVLLSGVFAGLTLGYMSLDETQLNVLSISGTPKQRLYANRIKPIRSNGHLLLVTLLLANMIVNESLPVISDPVLGGGVQSVVVSTVLIVIFAEIIPQSLCTRHGLYLGAKMAKPTQGLIYALGIISWPVAKLLEWVLGPHHGIIYRRAELKELIAMHSSLSSHGGDLKNDTVTIIGATLDLQEKVVMQAMTPINEVFMLSIDSKLDYELLKKICMTGHSRVPVYEEVDVPIQQGKKNHNYNNSNNSGDEKAQKAKKIVGILLVKQCVLLDPKDAVPLRKLPLNKVPFVPKNMPLLGILDKFQEGRSHMAIVSRISVEKAASVKKVVKRGLTQRLRDRVGMGESDSSDEEDEGREKEKEKGGEKEKDKSAEDGMSEFDDMDGEATLKGDAIIEHDYATSNSSNGATREKGVNFNNVRGRGRSKGKKGGDTRQQQQRNVDLEMGIVEDKIKTRSSFVQLPFAVAGLEQSMPADAVLAKEGAEEFLQGIDPAVMPLGIITLEDVLEELIGEEIYDEFDPEGGQASYVPPEIHHHNHQPHIHGVNLGPSILRKKESAPQLSPTKGPHAPLPASAEPPGSHSAGRGTKSLTTTPVLKPIALKGLSFITNRSRSAPPTPRDQKLSLNVPGSPPRTTSPLVAELASLQITPLTAALEDASEVTGNGPSIVVEHAIDSQTLSTVPAEGHETVDTAKSKPSGLVPPASAVPGSVVASRSASPAPSLEAILLDRKRRLAAAGAQSSQSTIPVSSPIPTPETRPSNPRMTTPSMKGTRFKSSPLGGFDRHGVVIAEQVKADIRSQSISQEDVRIPDDKDKVGPDKMEGGDGS